MSLIKTVGSKIGKPFRYLFERPQHEAEAEEIASSLSNKVVNRLQQINSSAGGGNPTGDLADKIQTKVEALIEQNLPNKLASMVEQDFMDKHAPNNRAERFAEAVVYRMRWLLIIAYIPLALLLIFIGIKVWGETMEAWNALACSTKVEFVKDFVYGKPSSCIEPVDLRDIHSAYSHLVLAILNALDLVLIGALLVMVTISGYENSISRLDEKNHHTGPSWLGTIDVGSLKVKVASSIIAISSIHLLAAFMAITPEKGKGAIDPAQLLQVKWLVIIHATLIVSALILAIVDKIAAHKPPE